MMEFRKPRYSNKLALCLFLFIVFTTFNFSSKSKEQYDLDFGTDSKIESRGDLSEQPESVFLSPEALQEQILNLHNFLTDQKRQYELSKGTKKNPTTVKGSVFGFPDLTIFQKVFMGINENIKKQSVCTACQVYLGVMMFNVNTLNEKEPNVESLVTFTCKFFRLSDAEVCQGMVERLIPTIYWIVRQRQSELTPEEFCGVVLQAFGCGISSEGTEFDWTIAPISGDLVFAPFIQAGQWNSNKGANANRFRPVPSKGKRILKILQLTDFHIDLDYEPGTNAMCVNDVLCCQRRFGYASTTDNIAGYYGDSRKCDAPLKMLHSALTHIRKQHPDIDLIYMSGDLGSHNIWYSDIPESEYIIKAISGVLFHYFPDVRIVPCLGNHEAHPINLFSPTENTTIPEALRQDWLYKTAYESWKRWIPPKEKNNFLRGGYFAVEINEKMRVLVVNTNICYSFNLWQTYVPRDPGGMLKWLQAELHLTFLQGKTAHIVGHVPPGHEECLKTWSREFYKIIARYRSVVTGQFYGHTHYDWFRILHQPEDKNVAMNVMWIAPGFTPYKLYNPAYRIYHMDGRSKSYGNIVDHETWIFDLAKANQRYRRLFGYAGLFKTSPELDAEFVQWFQLYQATKAFGIPDVLPANLRKFVTRMGQNETEFDLFYQYYYKATVSSVKETHPCSPVCKKRLLCNIVRSYYDDGQNHDECIE